MNRPPSSSANQHPTPPLHEAPLQALASSHQHSLAQCAALQALVKHIEAYGSDTQAQLAAQDILHHFDITARECQASEEQDLYPALIESMAGSDAVCLRAMTEGLSDMLHTLDQRWRNQLRSPLLHIADGDPAELSATDVQAFSDEYTAYAERSDSELLPMAERLLSDAEIERLGQAMHQRRRMRDSG